MMDGPRGAVTIERPSYYYDALVDATTKLDIWETVYIHVMDSTQAIVRWISSTGLRPYLEALENGTQSARFVRMLDERVANAYTLPKRREGVVPVSPAFCCGIQVRG